MVLGVALFSKLRTAKVFFTFLKEKKKKKEDDCTRQSISGLEGLMLLKHKFAPYFRATAMKVKCRSCHSGHKRYLLMNVAAESELIETHTRSLSLFGRK